jgi:hypothetical protein
VKEGGKYRKEEKNKIFTVCQMQKHADRHGLLSIYSFYTKSANNT